MSSGFENVHQVKNGLQTHQEISGFLSTLIINKKIYSYPRIFLKYFSINLRHVLNRVLYIIKS